MSIAAIVVKDYLIFPSVMSHGINRLQLLKQGLSTCSEVVAKELNNGLVTPFVLLLNTGVVKVGTSSHPAMDLILKGLNVLSHLEVVLELLNLLFRFFLGGKQHSRDRDSLSVRGIDHGGVDLGSNGEGVGVSLDTESDDFATPAVTKDAELLNGSILLLDSLDVVGNLASNLRRRVSLEKLAKLLLLIIIVWWVAEVIGISLSPQELES
jgi:hypothetical protein